MPSIISRPQFAKIKLDIISDLDQLHSGTPSSLVTTTFCHHIYSISPSYLIFPAETAISNDNLDYRNLFIRILSEPLLSQSHKRHHARDNHSHRHRHLPSTTLIRRRRSTYHGPIAASNTPIPTRTPTPTPTPLVLEPSHQLREQRRRILVLHNIPTNRRTPIQKCPNLLLGTSTPRIKRIAKLQRLLKLLAPLSQRIPRPLRTIIAALPGAFEACGDVFVEQRAHEDLIRGFGLVGGDFVAGLVDAGEGEVAVLADLAAGVGGVGLDAGVAGGSEGVGGGVGDCEGDEFAAVPVWREGG